MTWAVRKTNIKFWSENLNGRDQVDDLGVDGRLILEWILENVGGDL
jgi:hypothetical protein